VLLVPNESLQGASVCTQSIVTVGAGVRAHTHMMESGRRASKPLPDSGAPQAVAKLTTSRACVCWSTLFASHNAQCHRDSLRLIMFIQRLTLRYSCSSVGVA